MSSASFARAEAAWMEPPEQDALMPDEIADADQLAIDLYLDDVRGDDL